MKRTEEDEITESKRTNKIDEKCPMITSRYCESYSACRDLVWTLRNPQTASKPLLDSAASRSFSAILVVQRLRPALFPAVSER